MKTYVLEDGTYVGTKAEAEASGQYYDVFEIPMAKADLIAFVNTLTKGEKVDVNLSEEKEAKPIKVSQTEQFFHDYMDKVQAGNIDLDDTLLKCPPDTALRLLGILIGRVRRFVDVEDKEHERTIIVEK